LNHHRQGALNFILGREMIHQGDDIQGGNAQADYIKLFFHWGVIREA
jgi:hypothetical protein